MGRKKLIEELSSMNGADVTQYEPETAEIKNPESMCATCGKLLSQKVLDYCMNNEARFKGKGYCFDCQKKL